MIRLLKPLAAKLWLAVVLLVVAAGILIGAARVLLPGMAEYRADVEAWAAERLGQPVRIGALGASWRGLGPQLVLSDVAMINAATGESALNLTEVRIDLDLIGMLATGRLQASRLTVAGARLLVKRRSDGSIAVGGLEDLRRTPGDPSGMFLLPQELRLVDSEVYWQNLAIGGRPMRFSDVSVRLLNEGKRRQLDASLRLPGGTGGRLALSADVTGRIDRSGDWAAEVYLKGERLALSRLLRDRLPAGYSLGPGTAAVEVWSHWESGRLQHALGRVGVERLALTGPGGRDLELSRAGGRLRWSRTATGWLLEVADFAVQRGGHRWPKSAFALESHLDQDGRVRVRFGADFLRIQDILAAVGMFPTPDNAFTEALRTIAPAGDLRGLAVRYAETADGPRWTLRGAVNGLDAMAWGRVPGVRGLDGRLQADQDGGRVEIDSHSVGLSFPRLLRQPLALDRLNGVVRWRHRPGGGLHVESREIVASNADIDTRSRVAIDVPADGPPLLDLQTNFANGNAANAGRYYPVGIMGDQVVRWLDRAIISGRVVSGGVIVRGPLTEFPFHRTHGGRFEVLFGVEDLLFDYRDDWPRLEGVTAEVRFLNNSLAVDVYGADILESRVVRAEARIANLHPVTPVEVQGEVRGPLRDELRMLRESPLKEQFGELAKGLRGAGPTRLSLDFSLPLAKRADQALRLGGVLKFDSAILALVDWNINLSDIRGELRFTDKAIEGRGLQAQAFGSPVDMDVDTPEGEQLTRLRARARLGQEVLTERVPPTALLRPRGTAEWTLTLDIPHRGPSGRAPTHLALKSDLEGMSIDLPAPIGKAAGGRSDLRVDSELVERGPWPLSLRYADLVDAALLLDPLGDDAPGLRRGELRLGGGSAQLPDRDGLIIRGTLGELDVAPWLALEGGGGVQGEGRDGSALIEKLDRVELQIARLRYRDALALDRFSIDLSATAEDWSGPIGSETFEGFLRIPRNLDQAPIEARLQRMDLDFSVAEAVEADDRRGPMIDPTNLPGLDLRINDLRVNDHAFGELSLLALSTPQGLELERLAMDEDLLKVEARGHWLRAFGEPPYSQIEFDLKTDNLGKLLVGMGFSPNVKAEHSELSGELTWPGSPIDLDQRAVTGRLRMRIGEGRFLEVDPGAGRVFGLLSIGTLQRRLSLDFSDLVGKGLSFDEIQGSFTLLDGDAFTNDLMIRGPSARVDLAGRIGLAAQDYDQLATVTPEISSSLPVAGALAGGPAVGAALFLAQRLMGSQVDRIARYRFSVTGPWQNPKVERLGRGEPETEDTPPPAPELPGAATDLSGGSGGPSAPDGGY